MKTVREESPESTTGRIDGTFVQGIVRVGKEATHLGNSSSRIDNAE